MPLGLNRAETREDDGNHQHRSNDPRPCGNCAPFVGHFCFPPLMKITEEIIMRVRNIRLGAQRLSKKGKGPSVRRLAAL
jgi:hypothetical protein